MVRPIESTRVENFIVYLAKKGTVPDTHPMTSFEKIQALVPANNVLNLKALLLGTLSDNPSFRTQILPWRWLLLIFATRFASMLSGVKILNSEYATGYAGILFRMGLQFNGPMKLIPKDSMQDNFRNDKLLMNFKNDLFELLKKIITLAPEKYVLDNIRANLFEDNKLELQFDSQTIANRMDDCLFAFYKECQSTFDYNIEELFPGENKSQKKAEIITKLNDPMTNEIAKIITNGYEKLPPLFKPETISSQYFPNRSQSPESFFLLSELELSIRDCIQPRLIDYSALNPDQKIMTPETYYKIDDILKIDKVVLFGQPGIGKSILARQITYFINTNHQQFGLLAVPLDAFEFDQYKNSNSMYEVVANKWMREFRNEGLDPNKIITHLETLSLNRRLVWIVDNLNLTKSGASNFGVIVDMLRHEERFVVFSRPVPSIFSMKSLLGSQTIALRLDFPDSEQVSSYINKIISYHDYHREIERNINLWIKKTYNLYLTPGGITSIIAASVDSCILTPEIIFMSDRYEKSRLGTPPSWIILNGLKDYWRNGFYYYKFIEDKDDPQKLYITNSEVNSSFTDSGLLYEDIEKNHYYFSSYAVFCWIMAMQRELPESVKTFRPATLSIIQRNKTVISSIESRFSKKVFAA